MNRLNRAAADGARAMNWFRSKMTVVACVATALVLFPACSCNRDKPTVSVAFELAVERNECALDLDRVVIKLSGLERDRTSAAYSFRLRGKQSALTADIAALPVGKYKVDVLALTRVNELACSLSDSLVLGKSSGSQVSKKLKLKCSAACTATAVNLPKKLNRCPNPRVTVSSQQTFDGVPISLSADVGPEQRASYSWSGQKLKLRDRKSRATQVECDGAYGTHEVSVRASSGKCSSVTTARFECLRGKAMRLTERNQAEPTWFGHVPGHRLAKTDAIYRTEEATCPEQLSGRSGAWVCGEVAVRGVGRSTPAQTTLPTTVVGKVALDVAGNLTGMVAPPASSAQAAAAATSPVAQVAPRARQGSHRICSCHWEGTTPDATPDEAVIAAISKGKWEFDGPVLGSSSHEEGHEPEQWGKVADRGRKFLGADKGLNAEGNFEKVRVAVIDTTSTSLDTQAPLLDNNLHGRAVSALIRDTACGSTSEDCAALSLHNYMALSVVSVDTGSDQGAIGSDVTNGGNAGTLSQLSTAITKAVDDWRLAGAAAEKHLIINLSVGWDGVWGSMAEQAITMGAPAFDWLPSSPELVYESLVYASCHGALVFAAAGNRTSSRADPFHPTTPIYPAAWMTLASPTAAQCSDRGIDLVDTTNSGSLLYAVGGLDFDSRPLVVSRATGMPLLATVGLAATRLDPHADVEYTPMLTGTSMSTAAISGIAAFMWSKQSSLGAHQVAQALYASGVSTEDGPSADFCPPSAGPCGAVRRVTLCTISDLVACDVEEIIEAVPEQLTEESELTPHDPNQPGLEQVRDIGEEVYGWMVPQAPMAHIDPFQLPPSLEPWVKPQPIDDPSCSQCLFFGKKRVLDIDMVNSRFRGDLVDSMKVYLNNFKGYWRISSKLYKAEDFKVTLSKAGSGKVSSGTIRYRYVLGATSIWIEEPVAMRK